VTLAARGPQVGGSDRHAIGKSTRSFLRPFGDEIPAQRCVACAAAVGRALGVSAPAGAVTGAQRGTGGRPSEEGDVTFADGTMPSAPAGRCRRSLRAGVTRRTEAGRGRGPPRTLSRDMTSPESTPPGGEESGRGLSGVQRAGVVLGALAVLLIVFVVLQGGDDSGSPSSSSAPQTTATQTTTTGESTAPESATTDGSGGGDDDTATGSTTDDGSRGRGSDDSASETGTTETQPSPPAVRTIRVIGGEPQGGVRRLEYQKGDRVRFKVRSDVADEVHVHGYDLRRDVTPGGTVSFTFTATIEGRFEIELETTHTLIAELEVEPS
jgi:hypothetical protein